MSGRFTDKDILEELTNVAPAELSVERAGPFILGDTFLKGIRGIISDLLMSDPDSFYSLLSLASKKIIQDSEKTREELYEIFSLLGSTKGEDSYVPETLLEDVIEGFKILKEGPLVERRRNLRNLRSRIEVLIGNSTRGGKRGANFLAIKDPSDARDEVNAKLSSVVTRLRTIKELHTNFSTALANLFNSGVFLDGIDLQVDAVADRLESYSGANGRNISRSLLTSVVGLGMVDERSTIRYPSRHKYIGTATVIDGEPASIIGDVSLPFWGPTVFLETTVDGTASYILVPGGLPPSLHHTVPNIVFVAPVEPELPRYTRSVYPAPFTLTPYGQPVSSSRLSSKLKLLLNNEVITVSLDSPFYNLEQLADGLNDALDPYGISVVERSSKLGFVVKAKACDEVVTTGSAGRLAFFNEADPENPLQDLNVLLNLTYEAYGDILGVDVGVDRIMHTTSDGSQSSGSSGTYYSYSGGAPSGGVTRLEDSIVEPLISSTEKEVLRTTIAIAARAWDDDRSFLLDQGHGVVVNDTMLVDSGGPRSFYRVISVEAEADGDKIVLAT